MQLLNTNLLKTNLLNTNLLKTNLLKTQFKDTKEWQRAAYLLLLFFYLLRYVQGVWLWQLAQPLYINVGADNFYWLAHLANIPQTFLASPLLSLAVDLSLVGGLAFLAYRPFIRSLSYLVFGLMLIYMLAYHDGTLHHSHSLLPMVFMSALLCVKSPTAWPLAVEAFRFYACATMLMAGLWKVCRGTAFDMEQMSNILQGQHVELLYTYPNAFFSKVYVYLIERPKLAFMLWHGAVWLELSFIIGFFTRRADGYLLLALLAFIVADYFLMSLYFFEFSIWGLLFFRSSYARST
jgi:hypothetical protein